MVSIRACLLYAAVMLSMRFKIHAVLVELLVTRGLYGDPSKQLLKQIIGTATHGFLIRTVGAHETKAFSKARAVVQNAPGNGVL